MKKKEIRENDDDKFVILEKYKGLDTLNKILICMYVLIFLTIVNIALPYIIVFIQNHTYDNVSKNGEYDTSMFNEIGIDELEELQNNNNTEVLFICSENYKECVDFLPTIQIAQNEFGYKTYYLRADLLNSEEAQKVLLQYDNSDEFIRKALGQIPMVISVKKGKLVQGWVGVSNVNDFTEFLKNSGITKKKN